jgi:phage terminase large subunit
MPIKLSEKQSIAWQHLTDQTTNEIFFGGSAGPGKSFLGCVWHINNRIAYQGSRGLIGRSQLQNLKKSTLVTLFDVAELMGYKQGEHFKFNAQENVINWKNGSVSVLKDLYQYPKDPNFQSLGSSEFTDVFVDECTEIAFKAFDILKTRIRYRLKEYGITNKILLVGNPNPGWVKERYVIKDGEPVTLKPNQAFVSANINDNINKEFASSYRKQLEEIGDDYDRARLLFGDWEAEQKVERPFAIAYNEKKHVAPCEYKPGRQTIISIDFNIDPFSAIVIQQWYDGSPKVRVIDEIEIHGGTINAMAAEIKQRYSDELPTLWLTGDAMGNNRRLGNSDNTSLFKQLQTELRLHQRQMKIVANPMHKNSRTQVNYFLTHFTDFKISDQCTGLRSDMRSVQVDLYGEILKKNRKDITQRADYLDCFRYYINTFQANAILSHQKTGRWI